MAARSSLEAQVEHIRDMCRQLKADELLEVMKEVPVEDLMATWKCFLMLQDRVRHKIYVSEHKQLALYREIAALMILNKYVAVTISHELHGKIPREAALSMLKTRNKELKRPRPESSSSSEGEEVSSEEEIVFCASKRQRSD